MKKILALLLSLMLVLSLAACGGDDTTLDEEPAVIDEAETPAEGEELPDGRITDEQLADLTAAYNNVAVPYEAG